MDTGWTRTENASSGSSCLYPLCTLGVESGRPPDQRGGGAGDTGAGRCGAVRPSPHLPAPPTLPCSLGSPPPLPSPARAPAGSPVPPRRLLSPCPRAGGEPGVSQMQAGILQESRGGVTTPSQHPQHGAIQKEGGGGFIATCRTRGRGWSMSRTFITLNALILKSRD